MDLCISATVSVGLARRIYSFLLAIQKSDTTDLRLCATVSRGKAGSTQFCCRIQNSGATHLHIFGTVFRGTARRIYALLLLYPLVWHDRSAHFCDRIQGSGATDLNSLADSAMDQRIFATVSKGMVRRIYVFLLPYPEICHDTQIYEFSERLARRIYAFLRPHRRVWRERSK